jgi:hypothetical protein
VELANVSQGTVEWKSLTAWAAELLFEATGHAIGVLTSLGVWSRFAIRGSGELERQDDIDASSSQGRRNGPAGSLPSGRQTSFKHHAVCGVSDR